MTTRTLSARFSSAAQAVDQPDHVPQAGQFQLGDQQDQVGHPQGHQVGRQQRLAQVEDQVRVADLEQVQDALDVGLRGSRRRRAISSGCRRIDSPVASCLAIARRRKFMSSRSMFRARSAMLMFSNPFTSRAMSASPRARSRSTRATVLFGSAARVAAEVHRQGGGADPAAGAEDGDDLTTTAGLPDGMPGMPVRAACRARPSARRRAASMSSSADRVGQEVLRPLLERLQQRLVVVADGQDRQLRVLDRQLADHLQGLVLVARPGRRWPGPGSDWLDDVEEVLVPGALGFEPDEVHARAAGSGGIRGWIRSGRRSRRVAWPPPSLLSGAVSRSGRSTPAGSAGRLGGCVGISSSGRMPGPRRSGPARFTQLDRQPEPAAPRSPAAASIRRRSPRGDRSRRPLVPGRTAAGRRASRAREPAGPRRPRSRTTGPQPAEPARCRRRPTHGKIAAVGSHFHAAL